MENPVKSTGICLLPAMAGGHSCRCLFSGPAGTSNPVSGGAADQNSALPTPAQAQPAATEGTKALPVWAACTDPSTGHVYYWNTQTDEVVWDLGPDVHEVLWHDTVVPVVAEPLGPPEEPADQLHDSKSLEQCDSLSMTAQDQSRPVSPVVENPVTATQSASAILKPTLSLLADFSSSEDENQSDTKDEAVKRIGQKASDSQEGSAVVANDAAASPVAVKQESDEDKPTPNQEVVAGKEKQEGVTTEMENKEGEETDNAAQTALGADGESADTSLAKSAKHDGQPGRSPIVLQWAQSATLPSGPLALISDEPTHEVEADGESQTEPVPGSVSDNGMNVDLQLQKISAGKEAVHLGQKPANGANSKDIVLPTLEGQPSSPRVLRGANYALLGQFLTELNVIAEHADRIELEQIKRESEDSAEKANNAELAQKVQALADVLQNKLKFLGYEIIDPSSLAILAVEIATRMKDFTLGYLPASYLQEKLKEASRQLEEYEARCMPLGWRCEWVQAKGLYRYINEVTGDTSDIYPSFDYAQSKDIEPGPKPVSAQPHSPAETATPPPPAQPPQAQPSPPPLASTDSDTDMDVADTPPSSPVGRVTSGLAPVVGETHIDHLAPEAASSHTISASPLVSNFAAHAEANEEADTGPAVSANEAEPVQRPEPVEPYINPTRLAAMKRQRSTSPMSDSSGPIKKRKAPKGKSSKLSSLLSKWALAGRQLAGEVSDSGTDSGAANVDVWLKKQRHRSKRNANFETLGSSSKDSSRKKNIF